jgi:hypothetical protein
MTHNADVSGSLALSPRPRDGTRLAPRNGDDRQMFYAPGTSDPAQAAEIAQARVFERLLRAERTELQELAQSIAESPDSGTDPAQDPTQVRARLREIHRLLRALQGRFPQSASDLDS